MTTLPMVLIGVAVLLLLALGAGLYLQRRRGAHPVPGGPRTVADLVRQRSADGHRPAPVRPTPDDVPASPAESRPEAAAAPAEAPAGRPVAVASPQAEPAAPDEAVPPAVGSGEEPARRVAPAEPVAPLGDDVPWRRAAQLSTAIADGAVPDPPRDTVDDTRRVPALALLRRPMRREAPRLDALGPERSADRGRGLVAVPSEPAVPSAQTDSASGQPVPTAIRAVAAVFPQAEEAEIGSGSGVQEVAGPPDVEHAAVPDPAPLSIVERSAHRTAGGGPASAAAECSAERTADPARRPVSGVGRPAERPDPDGQDPNRTPESVDVPAEGAGDVTPTTERSAVARTAPVAEQERSAERAADAAATPVRDPEPIPVSAVGVPAAGVSAVAPPATAATPGTPPPATAPSAVTSASVTSETVAPETAPPVSTTPPPQADLVSASPPSATAPPATPPPAGDPSTPISSAGPAGWAYDVSDADPDLMFDSVTPPRPEPLPATTPAPAPVVAAAPERGPRPSRVAADVAAEHAAADLALLRTFGPTDLGSRPDRAPIVALESPAVPEPEPATGAAQPVRFRAVGRGGAAVGQVAVTLLDDRGREVSAGQSDAAGRGELQAPHPGAYVLVATAPEHQPGAVAVSVADAPADSEVLLVRSASLTGTVTDEDGPVAGARITVVQDGEVVETADTGADGRYRIADLAAGEYAVSVAAAGCEPDVVLVGVPDGDERIHDVDLAPAIVPAG